jgi:hypothetical protein
MAYNFTAQWIKGCLNEILWTTRNELLTEHSEYDEVEISVAEIVLLWVTRKVSPRQYSAEDTHDYYFTTFEMVFQNIGVSWLRSAGAPGCSESSLRG